MLWHVIVFCGMLDLVSCVMLNLVRLGVVGWIGVCYVFCVKIV